METQMEIALKKAGVTILPLNQRIWQFVKDNPGCTSSTIISKVSGADQRRISDLKARGLLAVAYDYRRDKSGHMRALSLFTASPVYDPTSRPRPAKPKAKAEPKPKVEPTTKEPATPPCKVDLDSLTIAEARQLYAKLKRMFS